MLSSFRAASALLLLVLFSACASTGATVGSGVGDRMLSRAPFYAGARSSPVAAAGIRVGALPIAFQPRVGLNESFDPSDAPDSPMARLLVEMNAYLDSLTTANGSTPVRVALAAPLDARAVPPNVRFGCLTEGDLPGEDCIARGDSVLGRVENLQQVKLSVGRPSREWVQQANAAMAAGDVSHTLVITVEVGHLWLRQRGLSGSKSLEIGSNHVVNVPWLTSLEAPVPVVQLTGALVDRGGRAVRIGAEGVMAKRAPIAASGFGLEAVITDADIQALATLRRPELPGTPLAWQEALRQLVHGLTR